MPEHLTNYQCPNCNGQLRFDPVSSKLKCDSCGSTFTVDEIDKIFFEKNQEAISVDAEKKQQENAELLQWDEEEAKNMRAYNRPSCGAQLISDANTAATRCPYCGNPTVVPAQFEGSLKPDYVIPFKLIKEDAVKELKNFYKGKPFLPKAFTESNHIEEIKGVYVPFWLYDGTVDAHLRGSATTSSSYETDNEIVTTTRHFRIERDGTVEFQKVPADGSSKMPDDFMDSIEPFDYKDLVPFQMSYLPGYLADKYDVSVEEDAERVNQRIKNTTISLLEETVTGYQTYVSDKTKTTITPGTVHYAFLPVWLLSTQYQGKNYLFAMNGQTGKMIGDDLPIDKTKMILRFLLITVIGIALLYVILFQVMGA